MSRYIFEGTIRALVCDTCWDAVGGAEVLLYQHRADQDVEMLVAAPPKHGFQVLNTNVVGLKDASLIASTRTGADGSFRFELGDEEEYDGGAFEIDVRVTTVPGADEDAKHDPVQFTVASVEPKWSEKGDLLVTDHWRHSISPRYWCHILALFGVWIICGRVVATGSTTGLQGMKVRAYDRDWIQDDLLGEDITDNNGLFRIYYTASTFKKTPFSPFINVEMTSGPDVYFEVEDSGGNLMLEEKPSEGRKSGRENVGHCFCVVLEVGEEAPPFNSPWFTHVGNFHILWDIDSTTGRTIAAKNGAGGVDWAFFGNIKMDGFCPKVRPSTSDPLYYRFLFIDPVTSAETPVTATYLTKVKVGSKLVWWDADNDGVFGWTTQSIHVAGSGATAPVSGGTGPVPDHVIVPDVAGWIAVDQNALDNGFYGTLTQIMTGKIVPGGHAPGSGAGTAPANPKNGALVTFIFETTTNPSDPSKTDRQFFTANLFINNWQEVRQLNLQEFQTGSAGSCTGLTTGVTILYTVDHEVIDEWKVSMSSAAIASGWSQPAGLPQGTTPRGGAATHPTINTTTWPKCSYSVHLGSRRALTDGEDNDSWNSVTVTFCKT